MECEERYGAERYGAERYGAERYGAGRGAAPMSLLVLLFLAGLMLVLIRSFIRRRRRQHQGLPVHGPWRIPLWVRQRWQNRRSFRLSRLRLRRPGKKP